MDLLGWFADVARDGERDCLARRKRRDETQRRARLVCLKCYDQAMAIGLRRLSGSARRALATVTAATAASEADL